MIGNARLIDIARNQNEQRTTLAVDEWMLWQLIDSAFPTGGFAHSSGLEAAAQQGAVTENQGLPQFVESTLLQAGRSMLPLVMAARRARAEVQAIDATCDAMLTQRVANRASRAQGQAYLIAVERAFADPNVIELRFRLRRDRLAGHLAPLFGAVAGLLELRATTTARAFLYITLRGIMSAAVRLNLVGPLHAQAMQHDLSRLAQWIAERFIDAPLEHAAAAAPLLEILQGGHDRLYSRLFQS